MDQLGESVGVALLKRAAEQPGKQLPLQAAALMDQSLFVRAAIGDLAALAALSTARVWLPSLVSVMRRTSAESCGTTANNGSSSGIWRSIRKPTLLCARDACSIYRRVNLISCFFSQRNPIK